MPGTVSYGTVADGALGGSERLKGGLHGPVFPECNQEQLEIGSIKLKQTEEDNSFKEKELESVIAVKEDEIRFLKKQLKEISKAQNCTQVLRYEKEAKGDKQASSRQESSPGPCAATAFERDELETIFWGLNEEFNRIRMLARTQTDQLSKFKLRREPVTGIALWQLLL
ncbi:UNVERIFIED_CONTAM: hypothetical protein K2H54_038380 [Gekko kuhli]